MSSWLFHCFCKYFFIWLLKCLCWAMKSPCLSRPLLVDLFRSFFSRGGRTTSRSFTGIFSVSWSSRSATEETPSPGIFRIYFYALVDYVLLWASKKVSRGFTTTSLQRIMNRSFSSSVPSITLMDVTSSSKRWTKKAPWSCALWVICIASTN